MLLKKTLNMKPKTLKAIICFVLVFSLLVLNVSATQIGMPSGSIVLNVARQEQQMSSWCWAACIQMVIHYRTGFTWYTQAMAVNTAYGGLINTGADGPKVADVLNKFGNGVSAVYHNFAVQSNVMINFLSVGKPIIMGTNITGVGGHAMLIDAFAPTPAAGGLNTRVIDPWYGNSIKLVYVRNDLANGTYIWNLGNGKWTETVA